MVQKQKKIALSLKQTRYKFLDLLRDRYLGQNISTDFLKNAYNYTCTMYSCTVSVTHMTSIQSDHVKYYCSALKWHNDKLTSQFA